MGGSLNTSLSYNMLLPLLVWNLTSMFLILSANFLFCLQMALFPSFLFLGNLRTQRKFFPFSEGGALRGEERPARGHTDAKGQERDLPDSTLVLRHHHSAFTASSQGLDGYSWSGQTGSCSLRLPPSLPFPSFFPFLSSSLPPSFLPSLPLFLSFFYFLFDKIVLTCFKHHSSWQCFSSLSKMAYTHMHIYMYTLCVLFFFYTIT